MPTITTFKNRFAKKPSQVFAGLDGTTFRENLLDWKHSVLASKDAAEVFTVCTYGLEENRKKANIRNIDGMVLDYDGGNDVEEILAALAKLEPYAHCWYTTYSHTTDNPKLRIVVPLAKPVTADEFERESLPLRLAKWLGLKVDPCCASAAQFYYKPSKPTADADCEISVGESTTLFDIGSLPAKAAKPGKASSVSSSDEEEEALALFRQVDALKDEMFGGVPPLYYGDMFHVYSNGSWHPVNDGRTFVRDVIEFRCRQISIAQAQLLVNAMKIMFSIDKFPTAVTSKITLANGTLDTDAGALEPHSPDNYHRSGMGFNYDPTAKCPLWLKTLNDIFLPDVDKDLKIQFLQEWFGYLMTPSTKFQLMLWMYGSGANGKSVITHIARELLGPDNVSAIPLSQLSARFIAAELQGKLANIVDEIATNALMQEDEIKKIVSGDPILVERKNKDPYFFSPTVRIFAATNTLPPSKDSTHGLDRRLNLLTCNRTFKPEEMDRDLVSKLTLELPGIFVWALEGHARLKKQGKFIEVPSCVTAMEDFKVCRNSVALFKRDCLEVPSTTLTAVGGSNKAFRMPSHELYKIYKTYCGANTYQPFGQESFGKKLKELGVEQIRTGGKRYYLAKAVNLVEAGIGEDDYSCKRMVSIQDVFVELPNAA